MRVQVDRPLGRVFVAAARGRPARRAGVGSALMCGQLRGALRRQQGLQHPLTGIPLACALVCLACAWLSLYLSLSLSVIAVVLLCLYL
jgi:Flp pilus assembly protein TadB